MLICVNGVLVLPLTYPPVSTLEQLLTFQQIVLSFMLHPSQTAPLCITAQIFHSNLPLLSGAFKKMLSKIFSYSIDLLCISM